MKNTILSTTAIALTFILNSCGGEGDDAARMPPKTVSQTFSTAEEAFNPMLNSDDRNVRYTATLYLKQKKDEYDGTIKGYGNVLFQVSHEHIRKRVYESMGWFGDTAVASILTAYVIKEENIPMKMEIVRALGEIGPDAKESLTAIERVSSQYARLAEDIKGGGRVIVQSRSGEYYIDPADKETAKAFQRVAQEAMAKIRRQTQR